MKKIKTKLFLFYILTLIGLSFITSQVNAETTIFTSDHLSVRAEKYGSKDFDSGVYERLNCRPYGIHLSDFSNLGSNVYSDKIIYTARLEFSFYLNIYTSALITDVFDFDINTVVNRYIKSYYRPNFATDWTPNDYYYQFQDLNVSLVGNFDYDGMIDLSIDLKEELIQYNDSAISTLDFDLKSIRAESFRSGVVGDFNNIIQSDFYNPGFSASGYDMDNDKAAIVQTGGDAANELTNFLNNEDNVIVKPLDTKNLTIQNFIATPLSNTESVNILSNNGNSGVFRVPVHIRPQISRTYRDIFVRELTLYYDTQCELFGGCGIIYGSSLSRDIIPAPVQDLALYVENHFTNQKFTAVYYASAEVEKTYLSEQSIDFQDPVILQGDWVWDGTGLVGGGGISIGGATLTPFSIGLIIAGVIAVIVIYYFRDMIKFWIMSKMFKR